MKNLVIAKRMMVKESEMFLIYVKDESAQPVDRMLMASREKALKYAFILKKRHEAIITKAAMAILRKPVEVVAEQPADLTEALEELDSLKEAIAPAPAEEQTVEEAPAEQKPAPKKRGRKPATKKAKKDNEEVAA